MRYDWYLAGPLSSTGRLEDNLAVFQAWARRLRGLGWRVFSPPEGEEIGRSWVEYLRRDIPYLVNSAGVALLPGWRASRGARLEHGLAAVLNMELMSVEHIGRKGDDMPGHPEGGYAMPSSDEYAEDIAKRMERVQGAKSMEEAVERFAKKEKLEPEHKETLLAEAERIIVRERGNQYGPPEQDFARTAEMMTGLFKHKLDEGMAFQPADVARLMILLKLSRSVWSQKRDNWTDMAGYAACGYRCENGEW